MHGYDFSNGPDPNNDLALKGHCNEMAVEMETLEYLNKPKLRFANTFPFKKRPFLSF
jgi:hypothetical protein